MKRVQQGFTLIELMIVVAIVGILAAIALPAYQDYLVRSKVSEILARGAEVKTSVAEFFSSKNRWPSTEASAGVVRTGVNYMATANAITLGTEVFHLLSSSANLPTEAQTRTITFAVTSSANGQLVWRCGPGTTGTAMPIKYLPASCR